MVRWGWYSVRHLASLLTQERTLRFAVWRAQAATAAHPNVSGVASSLQASGNDRASSSRILDADAECYPPAAAAAYDANALGFVLGRATSIQPCGRAGKAVLFRRPQRQPTGTGDDRRSDALGQQGRDDAI